tara:strand:- start:75 stop:446 length:372 start_codon:yes stop_codon:yes gene_type:complete
MNKDWWNVKNMQKVEKEIKTSDFSDLNPKNIFASYRRVLETNDLENTMVQHHDDLNPKLKILQLNKILNLNSINNYKILDAGCGLGITSNEIKNIFLQFFLRSINLLIGHITSTDYRILAIKK